MLLGSVPTLRSRLQSISILELEPLAVNFEVVVLDLLVSSILALVFSILVLRRRSSVLFQQQWFALQVRTRMEHQVATILRSKGYEEFLPTHTVKKQQGPCNVPLFPGYVFCRVPPDTYGLIVTTPGVIRIVKFGDKPAVIDPEEIRSIQLVLLSRAPLTVIRGLSVGDKVLIEDGPLRGAMGVLSSMRSHQRLQVSIAMMMGTVVAEVEPEWVRKVAPHAALASASAWPYALGRTA